jgi:hypothetical protein
MLLLTNCPDLEVLVTEPRPLAVTPAEVLVLFDWWARSSDQGSPEH